MILPEQIIIGDIYRHDNGWTFIRAKKIYDGQTGKLITVEHMDEEFDVPLEDFCKKFNEIVVKRI